MKKPENDLLLYIACLEAIIDNLPCGVWFKDRDGSYKVANKFMSEHLENPELLFKNWRNSHSEKSPISYDKISPNFTLPNDVVIKETQNGIFKISSSQVFNASNDPIGTVGYTEDLTQDILLSHFPGFAYRSVDDDDLTMTFLSEGCYELTGYKPEELLNKKPSYYDLIHHEYREKLISKWKDNTLEANIIGSDEYPITTATGETKWVWEQYHEKCDPNQIYIATEGFITDVTKSKLAENALAESEERFRTMFEKAPLGFGIFDTATGKALQINTKFTEILKRNEEEILSTSWMQYTHPDDIEPNLRNLELLNNGQPNGFSMVKRYIRGDGATIWINMTIAPFSSNRGLPCHLCMIEDITDRKKAEEEILFLSYHDTLTGLHNRRYYEQVLRRLDNASNLPLTMIIADVNGLKLVNDAFGHMVGDALLKVVGDAIRKECREGDVAARIGGDEFTMLLPKTGISEAEKIAKKITSRIATKKINNINCSISYGIATKDDPSQNINIVFIHAENQMYRNKVSESSDMRSETIKVITKALYKKSNQEQLHCERVSKLCEATGNALSMKQADINDLKTAGLLHDIGKIGIDMKLLNKISVKTEKEWAKIKRHSEIGYQILKSVNEFAPLAEYVLYHHERIDGNGYPRGIKGDQIPLQSKIISIVNAYDHMTNYCSETTKMNMAEAIEEIRKNAGTQFDKGLSEIFIKKVLLSK
ncbi:MAG TPA: HD domain-containing phosphohydrolase [Anaerovoracaceae bacterium]|nr:HD domain-containing phosphohydrolase [Anaerovoracaceae bacterium]